MEKILKAIKFISHPWGINCLHDWVHPLSLMPNKAVFWYKIYVCVCWVLRTSLCMLFGWWFCLCELPGVQVRWHYGAFYGITTCFTSFSPSSNSSIGVLDLCPMVGCKCLHMSQSAAGRYSQRTVMLGSCLKVQHSISQRIRVWCPSMGWILS